MALSMKRLVLLGGGHSHVEVLRRFGAAPLPGTELVLASPYPDTPYSGMLPGWIAGHYARADCHIDLSSLTRFARCRFVPSACNRLDPVERVVHCADGTILPYDVVSVDTGAASAAEDIPGTAEHALPVKPVEEFIPRWDAMRARAARGQGPRRILMVGGGAAGVEVLLAMQHHLHQVAPTSRIGFALAADTDTILPGHNGSVRRIFTRVLEERGVALHLGSAAERVESGAVRLAGGGRIEADAIVWATGSLGAVVAEGSGSCHRWIRIHPRRCAPAIGFASASVRLRRHCRHRRPPAPKIRCLRRPRGSAAFDEPAAGTHRRATRRVEPAEGSSCTHLHGRSPRSRFPRPSRAGGQVGMAMEGLDRPAIRRALSNPVT